MKNKIKRSVGDTTFELILTVFMIIIGLIMIYPVLYVVFASLSNARDFTAFRGFLITPINFDTLAYQQAFKNPMLLSGYKNTLIILVVGVSLNLLLTSIGAYVLSRKNLKLQTLFMIMIIITMYFSGGLIPFYFTVLELGLKNNLLALIFPSAISTFNLIIMRTSFMSLPDSLDESACLDGAGHLTILFKIILPISKPVLAVMTLYYAVGHWNSWFNAMLFLDDRNKYPLQLVLREILIQNDVNSMTMLVGDADQGFLRETIKYAIIVIATAPFLCIYPFLQKYFTKGVLIGAVKG